MSLQTLIAHTPDDSANDPPYRDLSLLLRGRTYKSAELVDIISSLSDGVLIDDNCMALFHSLRTCTRYACRAWK